MLRKRQLLLPRTMGKVGKSLGGSLRGVQETHERVMEDSSRSGLAQAMYAAPALVSTEDFEPKESTVDNIYLPPSAPEPTEETARSFGKSFANWWRTGDWE